MLTPSMASHSIDSQPAGAAARALAARINARIVRDGVSAETALAEPGLAATRDTALVRALVLGTLRWHHRLQWQAGQLLNRPLSADNAELAALIRLGLFQLQWMRIPDHAAVSATVAATATLGKARAKGLVNAVLRRFQREADELEARLQGNPEALHSHPGWLIDALRADWPDHWRDVIVANNKEPPMWLRVNLRRLKRSEYLTSLGAAGIAAEASEIAPGAILLANPQPTGTLPGFKEGLVSVQDGAAQLSAGFLGLEPGLRVLDACAAPGGKTAQILETCPGLAQVLALDRDTGRLQLLTENLERLGLEATVRRGDATDPGDWWDGQLFQRILIDAPCSAVGVIRRHPDIKVLRRADDVDRVITEQARLLRSLWPLLGAGGRLVYATCTVLKGENHRQIERFLADSPDARIPGPESQRQIRPGEANMDGFYYASIEKQH